VSAEILAQLRKMMPEAAVRQIYAAVVTDLSRRIEALAAAIAKRDTAEVRRIGHAIKGGCGMAGALQAAHLGALLETTPLEPQDNQLDNSAILLRDLHAAASALERMLEAELSA
jgi:HPt (histidine-containing phosphotransfer) domain-containing protein